MSSINNLISYVIYIDKSETSANEIRARTSKVPIATQKGKFFRWQPHILYACYIIHYDHITGRMSKYIINWLKA